MRRFRDIVIGILVLAAVFVSVQGGVGYFGFRRKSPAYWVFPGAAVLAVVVWYLRPAKDWTSGGEEGEDDPSRRPGGGS